MDDLKTESFEEYKKGNWDVYVLDSCTTTFDVAKQKIAEGAEHGTLIIADKQTGGKGRQARKWHSPSGGIWTGIILKPKLELAKLSSITLLAAVAVAKAIEDMYPDVGLSIKWPNDAYVNSKKVCGILTETILKKTEVEYVIVGIGINANNTRELFDDEVKETSISFADMGITVDRAQMASYITDNLLELVEEYERSDNLNFILEYYMQHMHWLGKQAVMKNTITGEVAHRGIIKGIDSNGQLLITTSQGIERIISGELSLRRE